ncbi:MFS transporter [Streptomyces sp. NPDC050560]|uniref:MFS transporter n=1 Tax=Streptomyces sp. NPDC050560 TaxID=3365630 RepID=UPI00379D2282
MRDTARPDGRGAFGPRFTTPLYVGTALNPVNSSLIATALVPIAHDLHVSVGATSVLVSGLYLASAVAQPTAGKLAEVFGPRRVFVTGILLVLLGGLVGGFGRSLAMLTAARVLIGVGTSAGFPSAMVLIRRRAADAGMGAPPGGVLGGLAVAGMAVAAVGPPVGGLLVGALGWHWAFLVNIPVTLPALAMALRWVPPDPPADRLAPRALAARVDIGGIAAFGGAMAALLVFVMALPRLDWAALAVTAAAGCALVRWELRAATPFLDLRGLRANGPLARTYARSGLTLLGSYSVLYGVTQWMEGGRGMSSQEAGLLLLPMGVLSAVLSRPLSRRNLVRGPLIGCGLAMLAGSLGILTLTSHGPLLPVVLVTLVFGVALATTAVGNQTALYTQAPPEQIGTASGLFRTFGYVGSIASASVTGIVFRHGATDGGLHVLGTVLTAAAVLVLAMTVFDRRLKTPGRQQRRPATHGKEQHLVTTTPALDPAHTALLVMDFQPAILGMMSEAVDTDALLGRVEGAIADVRAHGGTVAYVRVAFTEDDWAAVPAANSNFAAVAANRMMHHEEPATAVHERIAPHEGDIVVRKVRFGGMSTTDLDARLRERGITTLVVSGVSTSGVVLSTVIDAADRDYEVYVLADGVADPDAEAHTTLVERVLPSRARVIDTAGLHGMLEAV